MANRFEQPLNSQFVNTYVPIPFDAMMKAGQMKQQRYDQTAAAQDAAIQRVEMIKAIDNSVDEQYKNQAVNKMYDIRDQYVGKDLSDPFVYRQLNNDITRNIDKERIQKIEQSAATYEEAQKAKRTLAMNNKWNAALDTDPAHAKGDYGGWDSTKGVYDYAPRAFTDKAELFDPYYKDIAPDYSKVIDKDGYKQQVEGVSDTKINAVSLQGAQELASTPQGQDHVRLFKQAHPDSNLNDVQILQREMYDYGKQRASAHTTILAASLQDEGGASKKSHNFQNVMDNIMGAKDTVAGSNNNQKIRSINDEYDKAKAQLATIKDPNSPEAAPLIGIVSKIDESRNLGELAARKEIDPKIAEIKNLALTKLKAIPEFSQIPDATLNELIDRQFAPGFTAGAARFGNALHQGEDIVGSGIPYLAKQIFNIIGGAPVKKGSVAFNPASISNAVEKAVQETGITNDWSLGDMISTLWKTNANLNKEAGTWKGVGDTVKANRDKDERNILRDVVKNVNRLEKEIKTSTNDYVLGQMQHMVSKKQLYPIVTTNVGNGEEITNANGNKYISNTARVLQGLPITMAGFEMRELTKKGKYEVLGNKEVKAAQTITATWDKLNGSFVEASTDDNGNTILHVAYTTPKGQGTPSMKQYEIKLPIGSDEANKVASDFEGLGTLEGNKVALQLKNPYLKLEVNNYIDVPGGHDYKIYQGNGQSTPVNVKRENGKYIITVNGEQSKPIQYKEQVIDALYNLLQAAAATD